MQCDYYQQGICRSCQWLTLPYPQQLEQKQQQLVELLAASWHAAVQLDDPIASAEQGFRHKAKMVAGGSATAPVFGILAADQAASSVQSLVACPLYPAQFQHAFDLITEFCRELALEPYDIPSRRGELKYILLSLSSDMQHWMLRFVLRSKRDLALLQKHLPRLQQRWLELAVCSVNIQPDHKAILEGDTEILLTDTSRLAEPLGDVILYQQPQGFFQTNPRLAARLYQTAVQWLLPLQPQRCWDLFCGVGGFALHLAKAGMAVTGIEISPAAIEAAKTAAAQMGLPQLDFMALDAAAFAQAQAAAPDVLVVNPPRRGLGAALCADIDRLAPAHLLYSSCNPVSLAEDLRRLPQYQLQRVQLFDLFAHSPHAEVLCLLRRLPS
jgi:23S rRNA (uracil747-C5)-methyltransferase